jgi:hypothetical protein
MVQNSHRNEHVGLHQDVDDDATMLPGFLIHNRIWKLSDSRLDSGYVGWVDLLIFRHNLCIIGCVFLHCSFQVNNFYIVGFFKGQENPV